MPCPGPVDRLGRQAGQSALPHPCPTPTLDALSSRLAGTHPGCWWASPAGCGACRAPPGTAGSRMLAPHRPRIGWALWCLGRPSDNHEPPLDPFLMAPRVQFASLSLTLNHAHQIQTPPKIPGGFVSVHTC